MVHRPYNYLETVLIKKSDDTRFKDTRVLSGIVVGITCENVLVLHHRSSKGLPKLVEAQVPGDHPEVIIYHVKTPGRTTFRSVHVSAFPRDARLAIAICVRVLARLKGTEWELVPVNAVYKNAKLGCGGAHDIICRAVRGGPFKGKLFSVELKCKEVEKRKPAGFSWKEEVERKADDLWEKELELDPEPWAARIVVFCEMARPCHDGVWNLHASIRFRNRPWCTLWGWQGFAASVPAPVPKLVPQLHASVARSSPAPRAALPTDQDLERGWVKLLSSMSGRPHARDGEWVKVAVFLTELGLASGHPGRYLEESGGKLWHLGPNGNRKPRPDVDYRRHSGKRGGGAGSVGARMLGPFWGRVPFLREVALKHYPRKLA
jgi:hypothetical protein